MIRRITLGVLVALLTTVLVPRGATAEPAAAPRSEQPWTVPALKEWSPGGNGFVVSPALSVVLDEKQAKELAADARVFAQDLSALTGRTVDVATGAARPGQIELRLDPDLKDLGSAEAYQLTVAPVLRISAATPAGIWAGTRSTLQLLTQKDPRTGKLPGGTARDWPDHAYRGVSFCNCVTYWSTDYLKRLIKQLSYLKLNTLHVEMMVELPGFREFDTWQRPRYTPAQVRDLAAFAQRHHVRLVPQVNFPGHASYHLQGHPDLVLSNQNGPRADNVDMGNPVAYAHMRAVVEATMDVFGGTDFHAGGDEYLSSAAAFQQFPSLVDRARAEVGPDAAAAEVMPLQFNWMRREVLAPAGRTMYVWNDQLFSGLKTRLDPDIVVEHWIAQEGRLTPKQLAANGNRLINAHLNLYMLGSRLNAGNDWVYENFRVNEFHGGDVLPADDPRLLGAELAVWPPQETTSEYDLEPALNARMYPFAANVWGGPRLAATYEEFQPITAAVGQAPGYRTPTPVTTEAYTVRNAATGKLLSFETAKAGRSPALVQAAADGSAHQRWLIDSDPAGRYTLRNVATGACAWVTSWVKPETGVGLGDCATPGAGFYLERGGDGYRLRSMPSGQLLTPVSSAAGGAVRQEPFDGDRPQVWTVEPAVTGVAVVPSQVIVETVPGDEQTLEYAVTNAGRSVATEVRARLRVPDGVTAEPLTPTSYAAVRPGETKRLAWRVTVPEDAVPDDVPMEVSLGYVEGRRAFDAGGRVWFDPANLALRQPAEQSTTDWGGTADRAVDGDVDGAFANGSVTHTADGWEDQPWWQVDLGREYPIGEIRLWNRTDCCGSRLSDYYVIVADQPITGATVEESLRTPGAWHAHETAIAGRPTVVRAEAGVTGRYLRIHLNATRALSLAEVQVYPPTRSGR
ncbi:family 20 glycosylhydrolase [Actinopolymorpha alba]|uniref:family 20 glycosylhydrolase n=1 Tax=Actinopolymorpha alba TaxID=533267 RepID=UPI0003734B58|nr:family 20 glycosylhydrolase [Actinopolymorpha alba]